MVEQYDSIVIGTGAAGLTVAFECAQNMNVAIVDEREFGGTCALRGCDPKKVLVGGAEVVDWSQRMEGKGIEEATEINWQDLMAFKRQFTEPMPDNLESGFESAGIDAYQGQAQFVDEQTLDVDGTQLTADTIIIATGAKPRPLSFHGAEHVATSEDFLDLDELPEKIVFAGGGYISFEFANLAARAGAEVTILHRSERPLKQFDSDLVDQLMQATRDAGVEIVLNTPVEQIEEKNGQYIVHGAGQTFTADLVVHGAGRVPAIDNLALEQGNVERSKKGITVNEYLQSTSNPCVYACGDCAFSGLPPLTPIAGEEGYVVTDNVQGKSRSLNRDIVPSVAFTLPPLAGVGLTEDEAQENGYTYTRKFHDSAEWYTLRRVNEQHGAVKVLTDNNDYVLGAHVFGYHAEEIINIFALAMQYNIPATELKHFPWAYPTGISDLSYMV